MTTKYFNLVAIDTETTIKCPIKGREADPYYYLNKIVYMGMFVVNSNLDRYFSSSANNLDIIATELRELVGNGYILAGHNIKFDLAYLVKQDLIDLKTINKCTIWDTAYADYLLDGQKNKFPSLDYVSSKHGLPVKNSKIKEYWDAGIDTEDIPKKEILPYLEQDVLNTSTIAQKQIMLAYSKGILDWMLAQMEALKATFIMENNGLAFNATGMASYKESLETAQSAKELEINYSVNKYVYNILRKQYPELDEDNLTDILCSINKTSTKTLSTILFGGKLKFSVKEKVGVYKNGKDKFKKIEKYIDFPTIYSSIKETPGGAPALDNDVIEKLNNVRVPDAATKEIVDIISNLSELRFLEKELSTYVKPFVNYNEVYRYDVIHHTLNNTATTTGRLSSSNPNLQNTSNRKESAFKEYLTSRFKDGVLVEIDYSQLEVIALAYLSRDPQLIADIKDGVDIHTTVATTGLGMSVQEAQDKLMRRKVKGVVFGTIYGGGVTLLSQQTGFSMKQVAAIQRAFFRRYSYLKDFYRSIETSLENNKVLIHDPESPKEKECSYYKMPYGRKWFFEKEVPTNLASWVKNNKSKKDFWPYSKLRNYPVQGFATGDMVPLAFSTVSKFIFKNGLEQKIYLCNTVHDSIVLDIIDENTANEYVPKIIRIMENMSELLKTIGVKDFDIPVKVEATMGKNLKQQKKVKF